MAKKTAQVVTKATATLANKVLGGGTTAAGKKSSRQAELFREGVAAGIELYEAMEEAAKLVLSSLATSGTAYVTHKYGDEMGRVVDDGFQSGINTFKVYTHVSSLGYTSLAQGVAVEAIK